MILEKNDVLNMEVEITDICNLSCPSCIRTNFPENLTNSSRSLESIKEQLDEYVSLKYVSLSGTTGEPTINKNIFKILEYLNSRGIRYHINTNMDLHDEEYWIKLASYFKEGDILTAAICGTTQELHEKYRVNSNLETVLTNFKTFKKHSNNNTHLVYIMFAYNEHEDREKIDRIMRISDSVEICNSIQFNEYMYKKDDEFNMPSSNRAKYLNIMKLNSKQNIDIKCKSFEDKYITIDSSGLIYPCDLYKTYMAGKEFNMDYTDIQRFKFDFCRECNKSTDILLEKIGYANQWL